MPGRGVMAVIQKAAYRNPICGLLLFERRSFAPRLAVFCFIYKLDTQTAIKAIGLYRGFIWMLVNV